MILVDYFYKNELLVFESIHQLKKWIVKNNIDIYSIRVHKLRSGEIACNQNRLQIEDFII